MAQVREYLQRIRNGEQNPWIYYEVCKALRPTSFDDLWGQLPEGASLECAMEGWLEYQDAYGVEGLA